ncbi:MAG: hypothetical protein QW734_05575 [Candidatus Bathyarchaeia archaeon]
MNESLVPFLEKPKPVNIYLTIQSTFERLCKGCSELVESEKAGAWIRVKCKAEKCIK